MTDSRAVLATNEAFYRAFADGDIDAMEALWAEDVAVACIHPGWTPIAGRDAVMESWRVILGHPPPIRLSEAEAFVLGETAFVICAEVIHDVLLVATNIFVIENDDWRMVHHQAGPTAAVPEPDEEGDDAAPDHLN